MADSGHGARAHQIALEPFEYLSESKGKGVRSKFVDAFNIWLKVPDDAVRAVKEAAEQLHMASLLVDDIEDDSKSRRGRPVAHHVYGAPLTINSSNYAVFLTISRINSLKNPEALACFMEELLNLHRGQAMDIYWSEANECPTEEEYKEMVLNKTGGLFRLAVRTLQAFSTVKTDFTKLTNLLGLWFQIRDDLISLTDEDHMQKKQSFCEDIKEGKFSFPIIHAVRASSDTRLMSILRRRSDDRDVKLLALDVIKQMKSFEYTKKVIADLKRDILEELRVLGGNSILETVISRLES